MQAFFDHIRYWYWQARLLHITSELCGSCVSNRVKKKIIIFCSTKRGHLQSLWLWKKRGISHTRAISGCLQFNFRPEPEDFPLWTIDPETPVIRYGIDTLSSLAAEPSEKWNDIDLVLFWIPWSLPVQAFLIMSGTHLYKSPTWHTCSVYSYSKI